MNPSVAICISNWNNFEAVQLCVESVRKFTDHDNHRIIVYDDDSRYLQDGERRPNEIDLGYLRSCQDKGWIELIEGEQQLGHGGALNVLLNERCRDEFDYAVPLDGDVQILRTGWLQALLAACQKDANILGVCDLHDKGYFPRGFRPGSYLYCIGLIDMAKYREMGRVDWSYDQADRRAEPYLSYFADLYPPESNPVFKLYQAQPNGGYEAFDRDAVILDPGCTIFFKVLWENPAGYRIVPWPPGFRQYWHHHVHASAWMDPNNETQGGTAKKMRDARRSAILPELKRLREG